MSMNMTTASRRGRKRIPCDLPNCPKEKCTHCTCKGECGRGHESGHCGKGRYGTRANCNACKVAYYGLKKKRDRNNAAHLEASLVASGKSTTVRPPPSRTKEPAPKRARTTTHRQGKNLKEPVVKKEPALQTHSWPSPSLLDKDKDIATTFANTLIKLLVQEADERAHCSFTSDAETSSFASDSETSSTSRGSSCPMSPSSFFDDDGHGLMFAELKGESSDLSSWAGLIE
jgi:hypothetical protein